VFCIFSTPSVAFDLPNGLTRVMFLLCYVVTTGVDSAFGQRQLVNVDDFTDSSVDITVSIFKKENKTDI
jgi:hypothetical protein